MKAWHATSRYPRRKHCVGWELLLVLVAVITLAACQGINAASKQPTTPNGSLNLDGSTVNFGSVMVGASKTLTATATNNAKTAVTVASAVSNARQLSLIQQPLTHPLRPVTVAVGKNLPLSISFTPSATGNITIASDAPDSPVTVSLSVTGTGFSVNGLNPPVTLAAGQTVTFSVTFTPQSASNTSGNLAIASNGSNETLNITLSGIGMARTGTAIGQLSMRPASLSLGNVAVGTSAKLPVTLSAAGTSVTVSSVNLSSSEFMLSGTSFPATIAAGNSAQFTVIFTPQATGTASGKASFISDASNSLTVLSLDGTGTPAPVASVTVTSSSASVVSGKTNQFTATAKDARGNIITGVDFTWNSDASSVATVDTNGLVTAVHQGTVHITATASGVTGSAILTVNSASSSNAELFGLHIHSTATPWPRIGFGGFRLWDTNTYWAQIERSNGVYDFSTLDRVLAELHSHGISTVVYTFGQVPNWASSNPTDSACDFASWDGTGGCDLPRDINPDGSGTDQTWINFVTALAHHVNDPAYLQTHAHIQYWEPWNEWYRNNVVNTYPWNLISLRATYAQMVRMSEDLRCIITGTGLVNGNACTAMAIDSTAKIVSPSDGGQNPGSLAVFQNFLYCDGTGPNAPIAGSYCTTGSRGSSAVDIVNTHFYETNGHPPENLALNVSEYKAILSATDLAKPLWSTEDGWGNNSAVPDPDIQASWVARYHLVGWSSGLAEMYWYRYDGPTIGTLWTSSGGLTPAGVAYGQVYNWIVGSSLSTPCSASGTVWTCGLTLGNGTAAEVIWDTSQTCSDGSCATRNQNVSSTWTNYLDLTGSNHAITNGTAPVSIKPILLTLSAL
jgi:uncharacterized protein YjdB